MKIPDKIGGVILNFAPTVINDTDPALVRALDCVVRDAAATFHRLDTLYISSVSDSHDMPSRHAQGKALDISRIDGRYITDIAFSEPIYAAIIAYMQVKFNYAPGARENFGPFVMHKSGRPFDALPRSSHNDHIHWSVD